MRVVYHPSMDDAPYERERAKFMMPDKMIDIIAKIIEKNLSFANACMINVATQ